MDGVLSDLQILFGLYKSAEDEAARIVISRHAVVDLCAFDDVLKKLRKYLATTTEFSLTAEEKEMIRASFARHKAGTRSDSGLLREIRNSLGAHRTAVPSARDLKRHGDHMKAWGAWEHRLEELENRADLKHWVEYGNACMTLFNELKELSIFSWFSWHDGDESLRFYHPLRF
jgi:hypothetical protein